ncbi:hypothetical protein [Gordonia sp. MP11Mi]
MNSGDSDNAAPREVRRFRAVWTGIMVGAVLVVAGLTVFAVFAGVPSWHHGGRFPAVGLRWWITGAASATIVPAVVHIAARVRRDGRLDRVDIAATVVGLAALVAVAIGSRSMRDEARTLQTLPGVVDSAHILLFVIGLGLVIGVANLAARRARTPHRWRHRLGRRFVAGLVGSTALLATLAVLVAWPDGRSPRLDGAVAWQDLTVVGPIRVDWHETLETDPESLAPVPVPVAGGFALPGDRSVTGYVDGEQSWRLDFGTPVAGMWGASAADPDNSWLIVQIGYADLGGELTYGLDGRTGAVLWTTDALGAVAHVSMDGDEAIVLTEFEPEIDTVRRSDGAIDLVTKIDTEGCARPERFDLLGDGYPTPVITVPLICGDRPDRFAVYDRDAARGRRVYTGTEFGKSTDDSVRVSAADGGVAAVTVFAGGVASTRFVGIDGPVAIADIPDGWVITGLTDRGRGEWTVTAADPDGLAAVVYATPAQAKTVVVRTGVLADPARDGWAPVGGSLVTAGRYREPQELDNNVPLPQLAPLTYVGAPIAGSGTDRSMPAVTVKYNPCRQSRNSSDEVFTIGGAGVLVRCSGDSSVSREWFWVR